MSGAVVRREIDRLGELLGICVLAITWPVLDVFGDTPEQFVFRGASTADIVVFPLLVAFVPATVLWIPGLVARLGRARVGKIAHLGAVAVALFVMLLQVVGNMIGVDGLAKGVLVLFATALGTWLFSSFEAPRVWTRVMAFAAPLVVGLFLFGSPTGDLAFADTPELVELTVEATPTGTGPPAPSDDAPRFPNIVMIILDSLPTSALLDTSGQIDPIRYPALADLAAEATWYRGHTTINAKTRIAIPAILSGKLPTETVSAATWPAHPDTIFRLLGGTYHLTVAESPTRLCPDDWCGRVPIPPPPVTEPDRPATTTTAVATTSTIAPGESLDWDRGGLSRLVGDAVDVLRDQIVLDPNDELIRTGFEEDVVEVVPPAVSTAASRSTSTTAEPLTSVDVPTVEELGEVSGVAAFTDRFAQLPRVESFRAAIGPSSEPTLYYLHVILPHAPFIFTEVGSRYESPPLGTLTAAAWDSSLLTQQLSLQMQFTDALLADVFADLRAAGSYDDALIVVVADHASGLDDTRFFRYYDGTNATELMVTPLIVKTPNQTAGVVSDAPIESTDILPTLADMLDVEVPWETHGQSVLDVDPDYVDPDCDDVRSYVRYGENVLDDDDDVDFFELCANDIVPPGLEPTLGRLRADDEWATNGLARLTPFADLLGQPWQQLEATAGVSTVRLELAGETLRGASPPIGVIGGTVDESVREEWVAVAVDGRVAGISPIYDREVFAAVARYVDENNAETDAADNQFRILVPSQLLHEDGYDVRVAALDTIDGDVVATELEISNR